MPNQRKPVRVKAGRGDPDQHITAAHGFRPGQNAVAFDRTDGKSGEIKISGRVHAGHFRGFAADQSTPALMTRARNAFDYGCGVFDCKVSGGIIIKEEKRPRALDEYIGQPDEVKRLFMANATSLGRHEFFQGAGLIDLMRVLSSV